ncbi:MAG: outer membrane protein [Alphaproteobacteria bacterium]
MRYFLPILILLTYKQCIANPKGFYIGAFGGVGLTNGIHTYVDDQGREGKQKIKNIPSIYGIDGGYIWQMENEKGFYGFDFYFSTSSGKIKKDLIVEGGVKEGEANIEHKRSLGGAFFVGTMVNINVGLYAKGGLESAKFKFEYENLTFQNPNGEKYEKSLKGISVGLGFIGKITNSLYLGGEYLYVIMDKCTPRSVDNLKDNARRGYNVQLNQHRFLLRLKYIF